jgi:hypothetical protein
MRKLLLGGCAVLAIAMASQCGVVLAGDIPPAPAVSDLHGDVTLYGMYPFFSGKVGVNGYGPYDIPSSGNSDLLQKLDGFFMGEFSLRYGDWGVLTDLMYADLGNDKTSASGYASAETDLSGLIGTAALTYAVYDSPDAHLDAFAGIRYWSMDSSVKLSILGGAWDVNAHDTIDWVDPMIGLRGRYKLSDSFFLAGAGGIGGFGVGAKFSWDVTASLGYEFSDHFTMQLGYRAFGTDYRKNGDVIDIVAQGPVLGLTARF